MLFKIFVLSFSLTLTGCSSVRTFNQIKGTSKQDIPVEGLHRVEWRTPDPCPSGNLQEQTPRQAGVNFYLKRKNPATDSLNILNVFSDILPLPDRLGLHDVTVEPNNQTIQELEDAVNDAWTSSLMPTANRSSYSENPLSVRIVSLSDFGQELTANGSSITRIVYTIVFSNDSLSPARNSALKIRRISPPAKELFIKRLAAKGLTVYEGELFQSQSIIIKTRPGDLDQDEIKRQIILDYERNSPDRSCVQSRDLDIRFASSSHITATAEARFKPLYAVNCLVFTKNQTRVRWQSDPEERRPGAASYYSSRRQERTNQIKRPLNPALSFRMHTSVPVNLQVLVELEYRMTQSFERKFGYTYRGGKSVRVLIWSPDVDHATTVNFFVSLTQGERSADLDSRLFYAESIYRHLENSTMESYSEESLSNLRLGRQPLMNGTNNDPQLPQSAKDCSNGTLLTKAHSYGHCQLSLQFMTKDPKNQLPPTERILQHVSSIFAEKNKLTLGSAYCNMTFVDQEVLFRTLKGHMAFTLRFSFSYSQLTSGKFWNVWRLPFDAIRDRLNDDRESPFLMLHPGLSFRLYTSVPISIQYAQRFADYIKNEIRVYDLGSLVPWNPDINGSGTFDFYAIPEGTYSGKKFIDPTSYSGQQIYDRLTQEGRRFSFPDTSDKRSRADHRGSSSGRVTKRVSLSRQPFSESVLANGKEPNSTLVSCVGLPSDNFAPCLLPRTFTLLMQKIQAEHGDADLGNDDLLRAVGNAFVEANPAIIDNVELNVTLTDRNDDYQTVKGDWVTKLEFTLTYPDMESGKYSKLWRYPQEEVIKRHLATASANLVSVPFF